MNNGTSKVIEVEDIALSLYLRHSGLLCLLLYLRHCFLILFKDIQVYDAGVKYILLNKCELSSDWDRDLGLGTWDLGPGNRIENRE